MIEPLGNRVVVKPDPVETVSEGGIVLGGQSYERSEKSACTTGTIVGIGPSAYLDPLLGGEPWVKIGDHVIYSKYAGKFVKDPQDDEEYVVINDDAIQARIEK